MRTLLAAVATLSLLAIAPIGSSTHDEGGCVLAVAPGTTFAVGPLYVNDRHGADDPPGTGLLTGGGTWFYLESNGVADLQMGGEPPLPTGADPEEGQLCGHDPDTLIL